MSLKAEEIQEIRNELLESARPLFFFDDDADGISSYLLFYRFVREGKGVILKTRPVLDERFLRSVKEFQPDKIFVMDMPEITREFIEGTNTPIIWLDHHQPNALPGTKYFNPMVNTKGDNRPASYWAYKIVDQDQWIGMAGCVGDWHLPDFAQEFSEAYPDLLPKDVKRPEDALFGTKIGLLSRIFGFIAKGGMKDTMTCIKILTRIKDPYEILEQTTAQGKYVYKKYEKINKQYQALEESVVVSDGPILSFIYSGNSTSFTSDLSNELLYLHPDKFILLGREKNGEVKMSLRAANHSVLEAVQVALDGVDGYGGGHEHACGACVKKESFSKFVEQLEDHLLS